MKIKHILLLTKRLYKKAAFVFLLLLIPLTVFLLGQTSREDSAFMTIALVAEESGDPLCEEIIDSLVSSSRLVKFERIDSVEKALEGVRYGEITCAWIFPKDIEARIDAFSKSHHAGDYIVRAVIRETTVASRIVLEKLSGVLYKYAAERLYVNYIRENLSVLDHLTDEELFGYYDAVGGDFGVFQLETVHESTLPDAGYLMSPVRGLLAIVVSFGALAGVMYYIDDEHRGVFYNASVKGRAMIEFLSVFIPTVNLTLAVFVSLEVSGLSAGFLKELYFSLQLSLSATLFAMLVRRIFKSVKAISTVSVLLVFVMTTVCPVFFDMDIARPVQVLFPVTHYIDAAYGAELGILYPAILLLIILTVSMLQKTKSAKR